MDIFAEFAFQDLLILVISLILLGCLGGFLAGLLGVGGGIVLVPGFYYILSGLSDDLGFATSSLMHVSIATSLAVIVPTGLSSALAHKKKGSVDMGLVKQMGAGLAIGVFAATSVANGLSSDTLKMVFATAILLFAFMMMANHDKWKFGEEMPKQPVPTMAGVGVGVISALTGIGGATLNVPFMSMYGVKTHRAVGSASAMGVVISIPGVIGYIYNGWGVQDVPPFSLGYVNYLAWICVIPASIMVAPLGAKVAHKVSVKRLKIIFACFMVLVALNMWRKIYFG